MLTLILRCLQNNLKLKNYNFDLQMRTIMELEFQLEDLDEAEQMLVQVSFLQNKTFEQMFF